jgi:hypothetical protein
MRVRATATGFDNTAIREAGDEFEMPDGSEAHWFEPVDDAPAKPGKKAKAAAADGAAGTDLS